MSKQSTVYQIDGLWLRKHQLNNGIYVSQVLLPDNLAESLLRTFHIQPMVMHIGVEKMKRHLFQLFYIRNFQALATKITQKCQFCLINKPYPQAKLSPGTRIIVNQPGMIISLDICTIRSNSTFDSFLTVLDNFSKFVLFVPINRECNAHTLISIILASWVKVFGFPIGLCSDGAKHMIGIDMAEICATMNTRLYRISAGNSRANACERWNLLALNALKIYEQAYQITDDNFDIVLSVVSNMLNQQIGPTGFSPYFLQFGRAPRNNMFLSLQDTRHNDNISDHVKHLTRAQNICHMLSKERNKEVQGEKPRIKYAVGDFVLLRHLKQPGPRHGIKLRAIYHKEPFRIIRLYRTNAMLLPFKTQLSKKRIRGEGSVFKNVTTIARLSRLKPLRNPNVFLDLHISDKILMEFEKLLQSPPIASDVVIPVHLPNASLQGGSILRDFNPLVNITPENQDKAVVAVQIPDKPDTMRDICPVHLLPLRPGNSEEPIHTPSGSSGPSSSGYTWKVLPRKLRSQHDPPSSTTSCVDQDNSIKMTLTPAPSCGNIFPQDMFYPEDNIFHENLADSTRWSPVSEPPAHQSLAAGPDSPAIPARDGHGVITSRAKKSNKSYSSKIKLPSGKSILLQINPEADSVITNLNQ